MMSHRLPARVVSPGSVLQDELAARGWSQTDLAAIMNRPIGAINEIIKGTKQITPETAVELGAALGTSPEFWLNLETRYRLFLAEKNKDAEAIATKSKLFGLLPVREMQKRGWLPATEDVETLVSSVKEFLEVKSLDDRIPLAVNFRCTPDKEPDYPAKVAWVKRVEYLARKKRGACALYRREELLARFDELLSFAGRAKDVDRVQSWLANVGVICVYVPHLPRTYVDGAAFFLDGTPVVALSLRYDRLDVFWFNLCHELGHILNGHGRSYLDVELDRPDSAERTDCVEEEREANEFAKNRLLSREAYEDFVWRTRPYFSRRKILAFAQQMSRHPSIIVGRLQYEKEISPENLNGLHEKIKQYLVDQIDC